MPLTVNDIFNKVGLKPSTAVKWNEKISTNDNGVYLISLSPNPSVNTTRKLCEIKDDVYNKWVAKSPGLLINGGISKQLIEMELNRFWKAEENILYIGESSSETNGLGKRIKQFFDHTVGNKGPHTGGYWIKLLAQIEDLYIYYAACNNPRDTEFKMLMFFIEHTTSKRFYEIDELGRHLPFANLKVDFQKSHNIKNALNKSKLS